MKMLIKTQRMEDRLQRYIQASLSTKYLLP